MIATARQVKYGGHEFTVEPEPADFWGWVEEGRYDSEWRALQAHLRPEHTFLDLGAWVGSHSLLAGKICKRVIAVEPDPMANLILLGNLQQNDSNWSLIQTAISDKSGVLELSSGCLGASTTRANPAAGEGIGESQIFIQSECMTLAQLIEDMQAEAPFFIKMDVEGSEEQILSDLTFFEQHKPTLYIELHPFWWHDEAATWQKIAKLSCLYNHTLDKLGNTAQAGARELILAD